VKERIRISFEIWRPDNCTDQQLGEWILGEVTHTLTCPENPLQLESVEQHIMLETINWSKA